MFYEFLQSLGWPVDVKTHPGWSGNSTTSWKLSQFKKTNPISSSKTTSVSQESGNSSNCHMILTSFEEEEGDGTNKEKAVDEDETFTNQCKTGNTLRFIYKLF